MSERVFGARITANVDGYVSALRRASGETDKFTAGAAANFTKVGGDMQRAGGTLSRAVTLPLVAAGAVAVKMSADFDTAFARMVGLAGVAADEVDGLKKSVLDLAGKTAQSPIQLADALYQASSSGLDTADALKAVESAAYASAAGMGSAADVVSLVASATKVYADDALTAAEATDVLTATIREGRADPEELAGSLGRILPIAQNLGVSFGEVGGVLAYLSNTTGNTAISITQLDGLMQKLFRPTQAGRDALDQMGTSAAELQAAVDENGLLGALELLRAHGFEGNRAAMGALFDDAQGLLGALALLSADSADLAGMIDRTTNSAGAAGDAFDALASGDGFKLKQAWGDLQVALVQAGNVILPIVTEVAGAFADMAEIFSDLPGPVQELVVVFLGLAAAAGPMLLIAGSLVRNFVLVRGAMLAMSASATSATAALGPFGLALAAILAISSNEEAKSWWQEIFGSPDDTYSKPAEAVGKLADGVSVLSERTTRFTLDQHSMGEAARDSAADVDMLQEAVHHAGESAREGADAWAGSAAVFDETSAAASRFTESLQDQIVALEDDLKAQMALVEYARAAEDAQYAYARAADDYARNLDDLPGKIDKVRRSGESQAEQTRQINELYRQTSEAAQSVADSVVDAFDKTADGTLTATQKGDRWRQSMLEQAAVAAGPARDAILAYVLATNEVPESKRTEIVAAINSGDLATALELLNGASETRKVEVKADADETAISDTQTALDDLEEALSATLTVDGDVSPALADIDRLKRAMAAAGIVVMGLGRPVSAGGTGSSQRVVLASAEGRYVPAGANLVSTFGEKGAEAILPLDRVARLRQLLSDPRIGGPIMAALGMGSSSSSAGGTAGASSFMRELHASGGLSTSDMSRFLSGNGLSWQQQPAAADPTAAVVAPDPGADDQLMANRFARGDLTAAEYDAYLAERQAAEVKYSDAEQALWAKREQLRQDQAAAAQDILDAEQQARDDALVAEDQRMAAMFEMGEISNTEYERYLLTRQGAFEKYSTGWMSIWSKIQGMHRDEEDAQAEALRKLTAATEASITAAFDAARVRKELLDAQSANATADDSFAAAQNVANWQAHDPNATQAERDQANAALADSARQLAESALRLHDAEANAAGLADGTAGWAASVRAALTADYEWNLGVGRTDVAAALGVLLAGIPSFASGGFLPARAGGRVIRVAEGGQGEWVVPDVRMSRLLDFSASSSLSARSGGAGGGVSEVVVSMPASLTLQIEGRPFTAMLAEYDRDVLAVVKAGRR